MGSVADEVRAKVTHLPVGTFITPTSFGSSIARTSGRALARLVIDGELMRVRRGLYYKGAQTVVGMTTPTPYAIGLHIAGSGSGLAGFAAAAMLGLTTQVPSVLEMAVPRSGQLPVAPPGVAFVKRDVLRSKLDLNPFEIAVIEVACDWPKTVEEDWDTFEELVKNLVISGALRAVAMVGWGAIRYGGVLDDLWRARWDQLRPLAPTGTVALMPWSTMTR